MEITINEVVLSLKEDDNSYLKTYPKDKYDVVAIVLRHGFKVIHLIRKGYDGDVLPLESYYHVLDTYDSINKDVESVESGFEYFKVIEGEPVEGSFRIVSEEDE